MSCPIYPLTIIAARYGGDYEGAAFVAFQEEPDAPVLAWATGDPQTCAHFFRTWPHPMGRGSSPDAAMEDLIRQVAEYEVA